MPTRRLNRRSVGISFHCVGRVARSKRRSQNAQWMGSLWELYRSTDRIRKAIVNPAHYSFGWSLLRTYASCNLQITNGYQMTQVQIKLTDEECTDTIYQPVCQNAATTAIVDTLMKAPPEWKDVPRRKIQDRTCIRSTANSQKSESQSIQALPSTFKQNAKCRSKPRHHALRRQFLKS